MVASHSDRTKKSVHKIGILYCPSSENSPERKNEQAADEESYQIAVAIHQSLSNHGYDPGIIKFDKQDIGALSQFDWIFNLGESVSAIPCFDYEIAQILEENHFNFTGAGSFSLENCQHKGKAKDILVRNHILTPKYWIVPENSPIQSLQELFPLIVKPIHEDGSLGITNQSIVHNMKDLVKQVELIHTIYHQEALIEEYISGRDISVSIIGTNQTKEVLPFSECVYLDPMDNQILTYESKWITNSLDYRNTEVVCPIEIENKIAQYLKEIALQAFELMGCKDYARIDFRVSGKTPYLLDVNPNPSIHPDDAGFTRSWKATGRSYDQLAVEILTNSLINHGIYEGKHPK